MTVPKLVCPFPGETNPHVKEVEGDSFAWLEASGMLPDAASLERARRSQIAWMVGLTNPRVPPGALRLLTDWYTWLYVFDDKVCEGPAARDPGPAVLSFTSLLMALEPSAPAAPDPYAGALADLRARIAAAATPTQLARWSDGVKEYLLSQVWEAANREADRTPSLADYVFMRRATGAARTCFALIEIAGGYRIDSDDWHHHQVRALSDLADDIINWDNDLFSYEKEKETDNARHNLVTVIMRGRSCAVDEAMKEVAAMHGDAVDSFLTIQREVAGWAGESVLRYVTGLEHWMSGNIDFSQNSARYLE